MPTTTETHIELAQDVWAALVKYANAREEDITPEEFEAMALALGAGPTEAKALWGKQLMSWDDLTLAEQAHFTLPLVDLLVPVLKLAGIIRQHHENHTN